MQTFFLTFIILLIFIVAMSIGVILGRKPLKGSCGGVGAALKEDDYVCDLCGGDPNKCEEEQQNPGSLSKQAKPKTLAYDAAK